MVGVTLRPGLLLLWDREHGRDAVRDLEPRSLAGILQATDNVRRPAFGLELFGHLGIEYYQAVEAFDTRGRLRIRCLQALGVLIRAKHDIAVHYNLFAAAFVVARLEVLDGALHVLAQARAGDLRVTDNLEGAYRIDVVSKLNFLDIDLVANDIGKVCQALRPVEGHRQLRQRQAVAQLIGLAHRGRCRGHRAGRIHRRDEICIRRVIRSLRVVCQVHRTLTGKPAVDNLRHVR